MKGYTNKDFNLGKGTTLALVGSRVALFVPRLLGKISEKLILNPIAEVRTGVSHEEIKQEAIAIATKYENAQANKMKAEIAARQQTVNNWARDERGNVKNHFWYRANSNKLASLLKRQARLRAKPRMIMVATAYVQLMKIKDAQYTKQLEQEYEEDMIRQKYDDLYVSANSALEQYNAMDARKVQLKKEIADIETQKTRLAQEREMALQQMEVISQQYPNVIGDGFFGGATPSLEEEQAQVKTM